MKGFVLDTDTWIEYFHHRGGVDKHIADTPAEQIFASEVSIAELVVTHNTKHFSKMTGIQCVDWVER